MTTTTHHSTPEIRSEILAAVDRPQASVGAYDIGGLADLAKTKADEPRHVRLLATYAAAAHQALAEIGTQARRLPWVREGETVFPDGNTGTIVRLVRFDLDQGDPDGGWSWTAVVDHQGLDGDGLEAEAQILRGIEEIGIVIRSAGNGGPGRPYADAPHVEIRGTWAVVSQRGGLDV